MARTLNDYRREFEALKKTIVTGGDRFEQLDHNLFSYAEHLSNGSTELALQLQKMAAAGVQHDRVEPYLADPAVARIVKEMSDTREMAKYAAHEAAALLASFPELLSRMRALQAGLAQEIATRQTKFASKTLGINQSVNEMRPLLASVTHFIERDPNYHLVNNVTDTHTPDAFDRLYQRYIDVALKKGAQTALQTSQQSMLLQSLTVRVLKSNQNKALAAFAALQQAGQRATAAHAAGGKPALQRAQKDGKLANLRLKKITDAYAGALQNAGVKEFLRGQKDQAEIRRRVQAVTDCQRPAKAELAKMIALKL